VEDFMRWVELATRNAQDEAKAEGDKERLKSYGGLKHAVQDILTVRTFRERGIFAILSTSFDFEEPSVELSKERCPPEGAVNAIGGIGE
jgi:hypothetical protein